MRPLRACVFALATASCAGVLGFDRLSEGTPGGPEAGVDGAVVDAGPNVPPECLEVGLPARAGVGGGGTSVPAIYSALRLLDFGIPTDAGAEDIPGLNLDRKCSPTLGTGSCTTTKLETTFNAYAKDKSAAGLDNAGYSLIKYISEQSSVISATGINAGITQGLYGAVVMVKDWNGAEDDDEVTVELLPAVGMRDGGAPTGTASDVWLLDDRFRQTALDVSILRATEAWVTGGKLVARFKEVTIPIFIAEDPKPFDIRLTDGVITGEVTTDGLTRGLITGRWKTLDFLSQLRTLYLFDATLEDTTLCENKVGAAALYGAVKAAVCDGPDIRSDGQDDKALPCDALSAAARIETYRVDRMGDWTTLPIVPKRCETNVLVREGDDCAP